MEQLELIPKTERKLNEEIIDSFREALRLMENAEWHHAGTETAKWQSYNGLMVALASGEESLAEEV